MGKYGKRFLIGWIISSILMFGLSYLWHGVFLYDYDLITYPIGIYLVCAAIAYFVIGFIVSRAFTIEFFDRFSRHPLVRGPLIGFGTGVAIYLLATAINVATHVNVTFSRGDLKFFALDVVWQGIEQSFGGLVIGIVYMVVFERMPEPSSEENEE